MKVEEFNISYNELSLKEEQIGMMMGFEPAGIGEPFLTMIRNELAEAVSFTDIRGGYKIVEVKKMGNGSVNTGEVVFNTGTMIGRLIKESSELALFVCTAGEGVTERINRLKNNGLDAESYVADVAGSMIVEAAMDLIQERLGFKFKKDNFNISNRYSPGYCEWDIREQKLLFSLLPDKFCNIRLSDSCLMIPLKSVSGIIGIGKDVKYRQYICEMCNHKLCIYRNKRMSIENDDQD